MTTPFFKVSASGNDFIALIEPPTPPAGAIIRCWCRRRVSVGADGVFVLSRLSPEGGGDSTAVRLTYFNADGEPADLCLNATRCAAQLARYLGWSARQVEVHTPAGSLCSEVLDASTVVVDAPLASADARRQVVETADGSWDGWSITVGVPHFVHIVNGPLDDIDVAAIAPAIRSHPMFGAAGTNVDFVRIVEAQRMEIRSFERGVEGETLACGTGVLAAAAVAVELSQARLPIRVRTAGGFELEVGGDSDASRILRWSLTGDARVVAEGTLLPGSEAAEDC